MTTATNGKTNDLTDRANRALSHEAAARKARLSARDERRLTARLIEEFEELQYGSLVMDTFQAFKGVVA